MHTIRNVQEEVVQRLTETRDEIEQLVKQVGQQSEDNAVVRSEAQIGPTVSALRLHVDSGTMQTRSYAESLTAECRKEINDLRNLHGADLRGIHAELVKLRVDMTMLTTKVEENKSGDNFEATKVDLEATAQTLRESVRETATALKLDLTNVAEKALQSTVAEMRGCLQDKISKVEAVLRDVAERSHKDHGSALDGLRLLQQHVEVRFESLWLDTQAEAKRAAMHAACHVRDEIVNSRILDRVDQQMAAQQASMDARICVMRDRLCDQIAMTTEDVADKAAANCTLRVTELSDNLSEMIEATRQRAEEAHKELIKRHRQWALELGNASKNADDANALVQISVEEIRSQVHAFDANAVTLRQDLAQVVLSLDQAVASLRSEIQEAKDRIALGIDTGSRLRVHHNHRASLDSPRSLNHVSAWGSKSTRTARAASKTAGFSNDDDAQSTLPPVSPAPGSPQADTPSEWRATPGAAPGSALSAADRAGSNSVQERRSVAFRLAPCDLDNPQERPRTAC